MNEGIGFKRPQTAEEIKQSVGKKMPPEFKEAVNNHATSPMLQRFGDVMEKPKFKHMEDQTGFFPTCLLKAQMEMSNEELDVFLKKKLDEIRQSVMDAFGYADEDQLYPLGLRHHLAGLAKHDPDNFDNFKEEVIKLDKEELINRLDWYRKLSFVNTYVLHYAQANMDNAEYYLQSSFDPNKR